MWDILRLLLIPLVDNWISVGTKVDKTRGNYCVLPKTTQHRKKQVNNQSINQSINQRNRQQMRYLIQACKQESSQQHGKQKYTH